MLFTISNFGSFLYISSNVGEYYLGKWWWSGEDQFYEFNAPARNIIKDAYIRVEE